MRYLIAALALSVAACATPTPPATVAAVPWAERQPTQADFRATYPPAALNAGIGGRVRLACTIKPDRTLDCAVQSETPEGQGFGAAALALAQRYVVRADDPRVQIGNRVVVPIRYVPN